MNCMTDEWNTRGDRPVASIERGIRNLATSESDDGDTRSTNNTLAAH